MRRRWYYFKRMLQADRLFVVQMIGNIIEMIRYAGRWIALAAVCAAVLYSGRGLFVSACEKFYENYAVRITDDVVRGFLPAWKEDEGTAFFLGNRKNGSGRQREECREIFGIENENEELRAEKITARENTDLNTEERKSNENEPIQEEKTTQTGLFTERRFNSGSSGIILERLTGTRPISP